MIIRIHSQKPSRPTSTIKSFGVHRGEFTFTGFPDHEADEKDMLNTFWQDWSKAPEDLECWSTKELELLFMRSRILRVAHPRIEKNLSSWPYARVLAKEWNRGYGSFGMTLDHVLEVLGRDYADPRTAEYDSSALKQELLNVAAVAEFLDKETPL